MQALFVRLADHLERRAEIEEGQIRQRLRRRSGVPGGGEGQGVEAAHPQEVEELDATVRDEVITMLLDGWGLSHLDEIGVSREYLSKLRAFEQSSMQRRRV